jgi:hypothetical protein
MGEALQGGPVRVMNRKSCKLRGADVMPAKVVKDGGCRGFRTHQPHQGLLPFIPNTRSEPIAAFPQAAHFARDGSAILGRQCDRR